MKRRRVTSKGCLAAVLAVTTAAAIAGVVAALLARSDQPITTPQAEAGTIYAPNGQALVVANAGDNHVSFPASLSDLVTPPERLAVDLSGNIWIPQLSAGISGHYLYKYSPASDTTEKVSLPDSAASNLSSDIGVTGDGRIVLAYGGLVVLVGQNSAILTKFVLPGESQNYVQFDPGGGLAVNAMSVGPDDIAYIARGNLAAITQVDVASGDVIERPVKGLTGPIIDLAVVDEDVYFVAWVRGTETGGTRVSKITPSGEVEDLHESAWTLNANDQRICFVDLAGELRGHDDSASTSTSLINVPAAAIDGRLVVDPQTGDVWVSGREAGSVTHWEAPTGLSTTYQLPEYAIDTNAMECPAGGNCGDITMRTGVGDLAVAPNGDVWFTDVSLERIGVIHPSD